MYFHASVIFLLGVIAIVIIVRKSKIKELEMQVATLTENLESALRKIAELEEKESTIHSEDGLYQKTISETISAILPLGVPGLILISAMSISGFAGAAAFTAGLAALGGPLGMLGGGITLVTAGLITKQLQKYGFPVLAKAYIQRLLEKGESKTSIKEKINKHRWLFSKNVRQKALSVLDEI